MPKFLLILTAIFTWNVFAAPGDIRLGDKVDLTCTEDNGRHKNKINITIREKGQVERRQIPAVVPSTFIDDLVDDKYSLREFEVRGRVILKPDSKVILDKRLNTSFYGGLSLPDIGEGFTETKAYGSYAEDAPLRVFTISQDEPGQEPEFGLYYQVGFASTARLNCKGTIVATEVARPGVIKAERYDRHFVCAIGKTKNFDATTFEFKVNNLQNPRLMEAVEFKNAGGKTGWFVHGSDIEKHVLGKLNDGDAQILRAIKGRLISRYYDECGSWDCFSIDLDLAFPKPEDKTVTGKFSYRESVRDQDKPVLRSRADVTCKLQ